MTRAIAQHSGALARLLLPIAVVASVAAPRASADPALSRLRHEIEQFVREHADSPPDSVWIPPLDDFALQDVDPATIRIDLSTRARGPFKSSVPVSVALADDRRVLKRGVVTARVRTSRRVLVATRSRRRGDRLTPSDLSEERRDAATLSDETTSELSALVGKQLRRSLRSGVPVQTSWVEAPALVVRGQRVRLLFATGGLRIEGSGEALVDGAEGEWIRVVNTASRREVSGRVGLDGAVHVSY